MGDIVQYAAKSAVYLHRRIQQTAAAVRLAGSSAKKYIVDGYIVLVSAAPAGTVSKVIDPPAVIGWQAPNVVGSLFFDAAAANVGNRDLFLPGSSATPTPVVVDAETVRGFGVADYHYVGTDDGYYPVGFSGSGFAGNCVFDGEWVYNVFSAVVSTTSPDTAHVIVLATRWDTSVVDVTPPTPVPDKPANKQSLVLSDASYQLAVGADLYIGSASPQPRVDSIGRDLVVSVAGKREADASVTPFRLLVSRVNYTDARNTPFAWVSELGNYRSVFGSGVHAGIVITSVVTVSLGTGTLAAKTAAYLHVLDAATGATISTTTVYEDAGEVDRTWVTSLCTTADALWLTRSTNTPSTTTWASCQLQRAVGSTITSVSMPGWCPVSAARPGRSIVTTLVELPRPAVVDIGGGRIMAIVCSDTPTASGPVDWYGLEIIADTLAVVGVRGLIGNADSGSVYVSVVTPQVIIGGVITQQAVLLANVNNQTKLSSDGGATWRVVASGVGGTPVYRGNRIHPVTIGETL